MASGILQGAHDIVFNAPQFNDNSSHTTITQSFNNLVDKKGLELLLKESMPDAFHDSSARYPPPRCHPSTRKNFIDDITSWAFGTLHHSRRVLWMHGPAGVGKSAVAQSCAEHLALQNLLAGAVFFSRSNATNDSSKLFTSLSYQVATKFHSYGNILNGDILNDPTLLKKSITQQFQDFFVNPLQRLRARGEELEEKVIIIDGLDECADIEAQCDIIRMVATSNRNGPTPFRWVLFSRPEPHIVASFTSNDIFPLILNLELPVSRKVDHEILCYLTDEFKKIRQRSMLPPSWPSEEDIEILVKRSAGLFIYAAMVIRFVGERDSLGPDDQLRTILALSTSAKGKSSSDHPLAELDLFYTLILLRVPSKVLLVIQKILLLRSFGDITFVSVYANVLGLSELQLRNAFSFLSSVSELESGPDPKATFYHTSFLDFIQDPERSKELCIYAGCLDITRRELLERLNSVHSQSIGGSVCIGVTWPNPLMHSETIYRFLLRYFFRLCQMSPPLDCSMAVALANFQFQLIPRLWNEPVFHHSGFAPELLRENIPSEFRDKVIRLSNSPLLNLWRLVFADPGELYVFGHGGNEVLCWRRHFEWKLVPYPSVVKFLLAK